MDHWPAISVIIPNYNGSDLLKRYLPSAIDACERYPGTTELIVVDDASTDDSLTVLKEFVQVRTIPRRSNGGFSAACNSGIEAARCGILCLLNSDVRVQADFLEPAVKHFEHPDTFAVTPQGRTASGAPLDACMMMRWQRGSMRHSVVYFDSQLRALKVKRPYWSYRVQGAYFFVDAAKLRALSGFNEIYSPYFWEETDLSYRALKRGWNIYYEPLCIAYHEQGTTIRRSASRLKAKAIRKRNRIFFHIINIHDRRLYCWYWFFTFVNLFTLRPAIIAAFWMAMNRYEEVKRMREQERAAATRSDREIMELRERFLAGEIVVDHQPAPMQPISSFSRAV